jgi:3-dehydroquinate dehydratase-2
MKILVINGPNLNLLGKRNKAIYGEKTLPEINSRLEKEGKKLKAELVFFQSNSEGTLIDFIQEESGSADGIIINPGALTHYGLSLRDALEDSALPVVEVHISDIHAREKWRAKSVTAPVAKKQISGQGWQGYITALQTLVAALKGGSI